MTKRRHEIGIRCALGAQSRDVLRLVLGWGITLVVIGGILGVIGGLACTRLVSSLSLVLPRSIHLAFAMALAPLAAVEILASYFPAHKGTTVDPIAALRSQ